jgi:hypothetical protein
MDNQTLSVATGPLMGGATVALSLYNCIAGAGWRDVYAKGGSPFYNGSQAKGGIVYASRATGMTGKDAVGKML